jgi:hypothetical protein
MIAYMRTSEDRLDMLKSKYLKQIDNKQAEIAAIRQKLMLLDELKAEADSLGLFDAAITVVANTNGPKDHSFASTGLTDAVMNSVSYFGTRAFSPPEMRRYLLENGFKPSGKNFAVSVGTTLTRLAAREKILASVVNGRTVYRAKP